MAGRKRKPTHMHLIQGTARPCRINKSEPVPSPEPPRAAIELRPKSSFWFGIVVGRLQGIGIASSTHSENVMLLAMRLAEVEECDADIAVNGRIFLVREVKTYRGQVVYDKEGKPVETVKPVPNPAITERAEASRHAQSLLAEFGLSPASSGKVSAPGGKRKAEPTSWQAIANS